MDQNGWFGIIRIEAISFELHYERENDCGHWTAHVSLW